MHSLLPNVQVDDAIQPGLIALNWTSLNIDKYLDRIDKALGKLKVPEMSMLNTLMSSKRRHLAGRLPPGPDEVLVAQLSSILYHFSSVFFPLCIQCIIASLPFKLQWTWSC